MQGQAAVISISESLTLGWLSSFMSITIICLYFVHFSGGFVKEELVSDDDGTEDGEPPETPVISCRCIYSLHMYTNHTGFETYSIFPRCLLCITNWYEKKLEFLPRDRFQRKQSLRCSSSRSISVLISYQLDMDYHWLCKDPLWWWTIACIMFMA